MDLDRIRERLGNTSSAVLDGAYVAHMTNNLPESYKSLVVGRFGLAHNTLTVEEIKTDIQDYYDLYFRDDVKTTTGTKNKSEQAFYTKGKFKGDCRKCGKYGHKAADCRSKGNSANKKELTPEQKEKRKTADQVFQVPTHGTLCK